VAYGMVDANSLCLLLLQVARSDGGVCVGNDHCDWHVHVWRWRPVSVAQVVCGCVQRVTSMDSQTPLSMSSMHITQAARWRRFLCCQRTFSALPVFPVRVVAVVV